MGVTASGVCIRIECMLVQVLIKVRRYIFKPARVFVTGSSDVAVILERFGSDISEKKDKCKLTGRDNRLGLPSWSYTTFLGLVDIANMS